MDRDTLYLYMEYLRRAKIFNILRSKTKGDNIFLKPDKIYLNNTNLNSREQDKQQAFRAGLPQNTPNSNRTYSASESLA